MKRLFLFGCMVFLGVVVWRIGARLSSDAIAMSLGVLFGIGAGIPAALFVIAAGRRRDEDVDGDSFARQGRSRRGQMSHYEYPQGQFPHPPVIVLAGPGASPTSSVQGGRPGYGQGYPALPGPPEEYPDAVDVRQFKVVGESEEWVDEW